MKVKADGTVKVLDFGLAKALAPEQSATDIANSPTISMTAAATRMGTVLGTAAYMSPEQAKGRPVDKRTDIWAYGVVLFEMLTGRQAFGGSDVSETLAAVLRQDVDVRELPSQTPQSVRRLLRRCLERDRTDRLPDIGSARLEIADADGELEAPATAAATPRELALWQRPVPAGIAAVAALVAIGGLTWGAGFGGGRSSSATVISFAITPPDGMELASSPPAISPDGGTIAFVVSSPSLPDQLWLRTLGEVDARPLAGTDGAYAPFWAPDGRHIGFFAGNILRTIDSTGGPPQDLARLDVPGEGGTWNQTDDIVFAVGGSGIVGPSSGLLRISATGGAPVPATSPRSDSSSNTHPQFLPDGRRFLFVASDRDGRSLAVASLDDPTSRVLIEGAKNGRYVEPGYLLFARDGAVFGQPFDADTAQLAGEPFVVVREIAESRFAGLVALRRLRQPSAVNGRRSTGS